MSEPLTDKDGLSSSSIPVGCMIDALEKEMEGYAPAICPVTHSYAPNIYIRQITIPAGTLLTSMEHLTEHPFIISKGKISVTSDNEGTVLYEAPYVGVTQPHTRRALYAHEETVWTTFHITDLTDPEEIGLSILARPSNPLLKNQPEQWRNPQPTIELPSCHS